MNAIHSIYIFGKTHRNTDIFFFKKNIILLALPEAGCYNVVANSLYM